MQLEEGKTYRCENGSVVTVKRSSLSHYRFTVQECHTDPPNKSEVWTEDGIAYHDDCGYNIVEEVQS